MAGVAEKSGARRIITGLARPQGRFRMPAVLEIVATISCLAASALVPPYHEYRFPGDARDSGTPGGAATCFVIYIPGVAESSGSTMGVTDTIDFSRSTEVGNMVPEIAPGGIGMVH